jgi:hypothetical protein
MKRLLLSAISLVAVALATPAEAQPIRLECDLFTSAVKGCVPPSGGGTTNYLRADGTFAAPPGSGTSAACPSAASLGFVGDGSTDNVATWNTWAAGFTSAMAGYCIDFGTGWYKFSSGVSIAIPVSTQGNQALVIRGIGSEGAVLDFATGGGITINPLSTFEAKQYHISGLSLWTRGTTGNCITVNNTITTTLQNSIRDVVCRGVGGSTNWASGIYLANQGQLYIENFIITHSTIGINVAASATAGASPGIVIANGSIGATDKAIYVGNNSESILIDKMIFNGGTKIYIDGTNIFQVTVSNSVFSGLISGVGQSNADGIFVNGAGAIQLINNLMYCNPGFSCIKATNTHGLTIIGNIFRGDSGIGSNTGITIGTYPSGNTVPSTIVGNSFSTLATGINLLTGSSKVNVQSNAYSSNTTNIVNSGTGNTIGGGSP